LPNIVAFPWVRTQTGREVDELVSALLGLAELARSDYAIERSDNEIALAHNGHVFGVWRLTDACYLYTPTSSREATFRTCELSLVLRHSREVLSRVSNNTSSQCDRRRHERWPVQWAAILRTNNSAHVVTVEDVSAGGLRIRAYESLKADNPVAVELGSREPLTGRIAWTKAPRFGFMCRHPLRVSDPLVIAASKAR
jgi:PilZ domain